jgi:hypothetical protein
MFFIYTLVRKKFHVHAPIVKKMCKGKTMFKGVKGVNGLVLSQG